MFWKDTKKAIDIHACTVAVNLSKQIIKTVVSERKGSIKEQFSVDDYKFTIKGFLWYQGETDRFKPTVYKAKMIDLVEKWRTEIGEKTLSFLQKRSPT